jgi:hypothetical protein
MRLKHWAFGGYFKIYTKFYTENPQSFQKSVFLCGDKLIELKAYQIKMQKNLTIILADVVAQSVITIVRGVFPVRLCTVFFFQPIPVRVRR